MELKDPVPSCYGIKSTVKGIHSMELKGKPSTSRAGSWLRRPWIHSMELKGGHVDSSGCYCPSEYESIQWNWKIEGHGVRALAPHASRLNPFNGIERNIFDMPPDILASPESIQWNWKLISSSRMRRRLSTTGIHSMELKEGDRGNKQCEETAGIHSMELKAWAGGIPGRLIRSRNPFNGIERD